MEILLILIHQSIDREVFHNNEPQVKQHSTALFFFLSLSECRDTNFAKSLIIIFHLQDLIKAAEYIVLLIDCTILLKLWSNRLLKQCHGFPLVTATSFSQV